MTPRRLSITLALALLLSACASPLDVRYYTLAPVQAPAPQGSTPVIAVGPVTLPDYLLGNDLVSRIDEHRVSRAPARRWAEALDRGIQRVFAENLAARLDTTEVRRFPGLQPTVSGYRVALQVHRFEARGMAVVGRIHWTLTAVDSGEQLLSRNFERREPLPDTRAETVAAGLSRLLGALAEDVATAVENAGKQ